MGSFLLLLAANVGASDPAHLIGPAALERTPIEVLEEQLTFRCREVERAPVCAFTVHYVLSNPTARTQPLAAAFYGTASTRPRIALDGIEAAPLAEELVQKLDRIVTMSSTTARFGFRIEVLPNARAHLEITGETHPAPPFIEGYVMSALRTRHLAVSSDDEADRYQLEYLIAPIRTFARVGPIHVEIHHPSDWDVVDLAETWTVRTDEDRTVRSTDLTAATDRLRLHFLLLPPFQLGGPFVGAGAELKSETFRFRTGWQLAHPRWLIYTLAVDTDFENLVEIIPSVEAALPSALFILPSLSGGIGVPIQVYREVDVGLRFFATIHFPLIGVAFGYDLFFGRGHDAFAILATVGL